MKKNFILKLKGFLPYFLIGTGIFIIITTYIKSVKDSKKKELE